MNPEYEQDLEARVDRVLKGLPELDAPRTLMPRVLASLARRAALPWYRQPWQMWPRPLQLTTLAFLLVSCGTLCFACWELTRAAGYSAVMQEISQTFSGVSALWKTVNVLLGAIVLAVKHL